ncbi:MAG TPA: hypothetical protein PKZ97_04040 [Azospirillaceae bacterium]|nr:hypothetical protein [Azospirillaceae bacterium]
MAVLSATSTPLIVRYSVVSETLVTVKTAPEKVWPESLVAAATLEYRSTADPPSVNVGVAPVAVRVGALLEAAMTAGPTTMLSKMNRLLAVPNAIVKLSMLSKSLSVSMFIVVNVRFVRLPCESEPVKVAPDTATPSRWPIIV